MKAEDIAGIACVFGLLVTLFVLTCCLAYLTIS